ncbi:CHAT domain-containing protein [Irpex rosettiformis]|uniref:CHAT domain-containing protein n=1 Tax=Irpex rosettiformis TaxID=378272 RepID=A0ACB8U3U8_9APHY|nr:CHAT domain-containing protein [Irpex rosettiformis]
MYGRGNSDESSGQPVDLSNSHEGARSFELVVEGLTELAMKLHQRYEKLRDLEDLNYTFAVTRLLSSIIPDSHPAKASALSNLAGARRARFERFDEMRDLEAAIAALSHAIELTPDWRPDQPLLLNNLSNLKAARFHRLGTLYDLDAAIKANTRAIELTPGDYPYKPEWLRLLSNAHETRFERLGTLDDLGATIIARRSAVDLTPDDHPDKPSRLKALGDAYKIRFQRLDNLDDLENALASQSRAIALTPDGHPDKPLLLNILGDTQRERGLRLATPDDLDVAIANLNKAIALTPDHHPGKSTWLSNLGVAQNTRFVVRGDAKDLKAAIETMTRVVLLTPDGDPKKPLRLANLGTAQHLLFERSGSLDDLETAVASKTQAVELLSDDSPEKPRFLNNLGISLRVRFRKVGDLDDWKMAIASYTKALELTPKGHTMRARLFEGLGNTHIARTHSSQGIFGDLFSAIHFYSSSLSEESGDPGTKMRSGTALIELLADPALPPEHEVLFGGSFAKQLLEVYQNVLDLIPQVIWLGHNVNRRYEEVVRLGNLSNQAAAAAIAAGQYTRAVEWLERGRSIVWSQVLHLRTPLEDLQRHDPELAARLERTSRALQSDNSTTQDLTWSETQLSVSLDTQTRSHYSLAAEYDKLLAEVRGIKGFANFLLPMTFSQLQSACASTHVVVVNVYESRCDALILHGPNCQVTHVPLSAFSSQQAEEMQTRLRNVLRNERLLGRFRGGEVAEEHPVDRGGRTRNPHNDDFIRKILSDLWIRVVNPVLETIAKFTKSNNDDALPHVTWCPTGPLVFLPLHAAGIYTERGPTKTAMDFAVSSYTPTLEALLKPRTLSKSRTTTRASNPRILIISQPNTPGKASIPNTKKEAELVQSLFPRSAKILDGEKAVVETVLKNMGAYEWIHLACHGGQNSQDPTQSEFALHDGPLKLSALMNKELPIAELAVLSACQTATGDEKLSEEAVHLAAAMLNVGYRSVIGTMWSISDRTAPEVARRFYESLRSQLDSGEEPQPAYALHVAIKRLHRTEDLIRWIPFVHYGL